MDQQPSIRRLVEPIFKRVQLLPDARVVSPHGPGRRADVAHAAHGNEGAKLVERRGQEFVDLRAGWSTGPIKDPRLRHVEPIGHFVCHGVTVKRVLM
jgi:hypothetical protein